jgi:hypothetical protein
MKSEFRERLNVLFIFLFEVFEGRFGKLGRLFLFSEHQSPSAGSKVNHLVRCWAVGNH